MKIHDAGLKEITDLKNLSALDLNLADITDLGIKELSRLKQLRKLDLTYTKVTDSGLKQLGAYEARSCASAVLTSRTPA